MAGHNHNFSPLCLATRWGEPPPFNQILALSLKSILCYMFALQLRMKSDISENASILCLQTWWQPHAYRGVKQSSAVLETSFIHS